MAAKRPKQGKTKHAQTKTRTKTQAKPQTKPQAKAQNRDIKDLPHGVHNRIRPSAKKNDAAVNIALIILGLFLLFCLFAGSAAGIAGAVIGDALKGLLGIGGYAAPACLCGVCAYRLAGGQAWDRVKFRLLAAFIVCLAGLAHALGGAAVQAEGVFGYIAAVFAGGGPANGGVIGAVIGNALRAALDGGAVFVLAAGMFILLVFLCGSAAAALFFRLRDFIKNLPADDDEYEYHEIREAGAPEGPAKHAVPNKKATVDIEHGEHSEHAPAPEQGLLLVHEEIGGKSVRSKISILKRHNSPVSSVITLDGGAEADGRESERIYDDIHAGEQAAEPTGYENITIRGFDEEKEKREESEEGENEYAADDADNEPDGEADNEPDGGWGDDNDIDDDNYAYSPPAQRAPAQASQFGRALAINTSYIFPPLDLLNPRPLEYASSASRAQIYENSRKLEDTLKSFGVEAKVVEVSRGPTITRYELSPGQGVKVSRISSLADDLALNLAAVGIRIEAPIPGKAAVGIEIPNKEVTPVFLREVLEDRQFINYPSKLAFGLGKDIAGNVVVTDIAKMPHLLIAGATGSGKSVCINTLITSIIYKANPDEVKLLMVDPKVVELGVYNGIPHLLIPVVTDPKKAASALNWAVEEMLTRYKLFAQTSVRDLKGYNEALKARGEDKFLPQLVIIIDELADLMMAAPGEVEDSICRLAQMARAAGIYLIIATQRPSVDVITGLIKANVPSRLAFMVSSGTDSRTILDMNGAEKLLGKGDMLFYPVSMSKPMRIQGAFISDHEVEAVVSFVKRQGEKQYDQGMIERITSGAGANGFEGERDELFVPAAEFLIKREKGSASILQRQFKIGYNRASRLIEQLEASGVVGPEDGAKPRKVLVSLGQWAKMLEQFESKE